MRKFASIGAVAILVIAVGVGNALAGTGTTSKVIAFSASYAGTATTQQTDSIVDIASNGTGKGTLLGAGKITGKGIGDSSIRPCVPFAGTGTMTGTAGTKLNFKVISGTKGCGDEAGEQFSLVGHATVLSATGKLLKAKGTLKLTGFYNRTDGTFNVKFAGRLTQ